MMVPVDFGSLPDDQLVVVEARHIRALLLQRGGSSMLGHNDLRDVETNTLVLELVKHCAPIAAKRCPTCWGVLEGNTCCP